MDFSVVTDKLKAVIIDGTNSEQSIKGEDRASVKPFGLKQRINTILIYTI